MGASGEEGQTGRRPKPRGTSGGRQVLPRTVTASRGHAFAGTASAPPPAAQPEPEAGTRRIRRPPEPTATRAGRAPLRRGTGAAPAATRGTPAASWRADGPA